MITPQQSTLLQHRLSFWGHLTPPQQQQLLLHTTRVTYEKGRSFYHAHEHCTGLLLIEKGQLRTYMLSENGKEITLYRLYDGDLCILSAACVLDAITFEVAMDAEEDTQVLQVDAAYLHQMAEQNIYVKCFGYELAASRFSDVMWAMQQLLFFSADQRLAIFLLGELEKVGGDELHLTHEQIARYMGSAREVVTRLLRYFAQEGIVQSSRGTLKVLNWKKLRKLGQAMGQ